MMKICGVGLLALCLADAPIALAQAPSISLGELLAQGAEAKAVVPSPVNTHSVQAPNVHLVYMQLKKQLFVCRVSFYADLNDNPIRPSHPDMLVNTCWAFE